MKIGIMGTHGVGKTTFAYQLLAEKKKENPNLKVGIVTEVARDCPFPINEKTTKKAQLWIFAEQLKREIEAEKKNDIIICDRTLLDNLVYSNNAGFYDLVDDLFPFTKHWMCTYSEVYFLRIPEDVELVDDGIRSVKLSFQRMIDLNMEIWIKVYNINVKEVRSVKDAVYS
jgi:tRNA uridine 5-carbamoylmethylation protein Kti12